MAACQQFQSLLMRTRHRNGPQQQLLPKEAAETLIQEALAAREDDILELDEYAKEVLNGLLNDLRDSISLRLEQSQQDLREARETNEELGVMLQQAGDKLLVALGQNAEIKGELHELAQEVLLKDCEHQAELVESKSEAAAARRNVQQLERQRQKVQQLLQHYDIKLRQVEEQKILCAHQLAREEGKRRNLEAKLVEVQEQLVQLSLKYQRIERSYDEISQSLESKEEKIKHLNRIIEESQYLSSLSPHSRPKIDTQISQQEDKSFSQHSHKIKKTLNEEEIPLIRLSQSYLPNEKSFKSISLSIEEQQESPEQQLPKSTERVQVVSERKNAKKGTKLVHSHQKKPSKEVLSLKKEAEKPKSNVALSKKECSNAVKSKLSSIFKDRLQYRSENQDKFEQRLQDLKERIKEKDAAIVKLKNQVAFLKTVKTEPLTVASNAREVKSNISVHRLIADIEDMHRIIRQLTLRKNSAEEQLAQERERCNYYKAEYRKVYENYLLKNAESAAYSEQLSELEQETSRERRIEGRQANILEEEKDQFENLSSKFNNLARNHQHRYESSEEEEQIGKKKDYYSIQNVYLVDRSDIDLTLENDRKLITGNLCESAEHSPAKAVLNEQSSQLEEFAFQLEEIKAKEAANQGEYTERLLLSELMQTSRRQNSLTEFQLFFSEHSEQVLELVSYGCLAESSGRERQLAIHQQESIAILPMPKRCVIERCIELITLPLEKKEASIGRDIQLIDAEMQVQVSSDDCGTMCSPRLSDAATSAQIETKQAQTNTVQKQTVQFGVGERVSFAEFGFSSWVTNTDYGFTSQVSSQEAGISASVITNTTSTNTPQIGIQHEQVQTTIMLQHQAIQVEIQQTQVHTQTQRHPMTHNHFEMIRQQVTKSHLLFQRLFTLTIDSQPIKTAKNYLCSAQLSHSIQPTTKRGLFEPAAQMPRLNLSFLQSSRANQEDEELFDDDHQSDFQSFSSFTSIQQAEQLQQGKESINLNQLHSGRTRSSSQQLNSQRSEKAENDKKTAKAKIKSVIKQSMENSSCSDSSVRKQANQKSAKQHKTAEQTPAVGCKAKASQSPSIHKQPQLFSKKELSVIKDYFYMLERMEMVQEFTVSAKQSHIERYDFHRNMYAFLAEKGGKVDKFAVWRGKVIRFGAKSEFIELVNYSQSCKCFKGSYVSLGNCEFRIVQDRLQVHRLNKRRSFKGEMENGEWQIQKIWAFATN